MLHKFALFLALNLSLFALASGRALAAKSVANPPANQTKLYDLKNNFAYAFREINGVSLSPGNHQSYEKAYAEIKSRMEAAQKNLKGKTKEPSQGPEHDLCVKALAGTLITLTDIVENEYTICKLPNDILVQAFDLVQFSTKKKN
jgi:hypothetical protein